MSFTGKLHARGPDALCSPFGVMRSFGGTLAGIPSHGPYTSSHEDSAAAAAAAVLAAAVVGSPRNDSMSLLHHSPGSSHSGSLSATLHHSPPNHDPFAAYSLQQQQQQPHPLAAYMPHGMQQYTMGQQRRSSRGSATAYEGPTTKATRLSRSNSEAAAKEQQKSPSRLPDTPTRSQALPDSGG